MKSYPEVAIIGRTNVDWAAIQNFLNDEEVTWRRDGRARDPDELVEFAGRICYMSFGDRQSPKSNKEYIDNLIMKGHDSVLEHASWTFLLSGVSRAFTHQLVRHRVGFSYSQLSQQYVTQSDLDFIKPFRSEEFPSVDAKWDRVVETVRDAYNDIVSELIRSANQDVYRTKAELRRFIMSAARSILPNAIETRIVFTANARALRHFLKLRGGIAGDREMREVSAALLRLLHEEARSLFADFRIEHLADGSPIVQVVGSPGRDGDGTRAAETV